jgi:hypothetical protein
LFSKEEVKQAVFDMKKNAAPGPPNGFGAAFFHSLWELDRGKYLAMFLDFHKREQTLVPKA